MADFIEKTVDLKAPVERVWRAISDYREFGTWFRVDLEAPFEVGRFARGKITYPGYEHIEWKAMITEIRPPELLAFTWQPYAVDPDRDYSAEESTLVEFMLKATGEGTRLVIRESGFDRIPEDRRDEAFRMNDGGWTVQAENVRQHVDG